MGGWAAPRRRAGQEGLWSYIDIYDLADAIVLAASNTTLEGHEVLYIAAADNIGGRDLAQAMADHYGDAVPVRPLTRVDASGISCEKAGRLLGWTPRRSWRDYLDEQGRPLTSTSTSTMQASPKI
jgi:UDP-glucose 4-epimerase